MTRSRPDTPLPEQAQSYEQFCRRAAHEQMLCQQSSWWGWGMLAIAAAIPPGFIAILFFIGLLDPNPAWWQWLCAFGFSGLATWIFSFSMRRAAWGTPRNEEIGEMWPIWHEWLQLGLAPYYDFEVPGFTGPGGASSAVWRIWPDGDESGARKPLPPEQAITDEQYRCRLAYEAVLCLTRPFLGPHGGNFAAWVGTAIGTVLTIVFAVDLIGSDSVPWAAAKMLGFAAFTLLMVSFPVRAFRRDIPRLRQVKRMLERWEAEYEGDLNPPAPPPARHPFNEDLAGRVW